MEEQRILGLDVGERRIGVALSDASGRLATALTTITATPHEHALAQLARLSTKHAVRAIVIGLPLTLRGEIGPQAASVQRFAASLEQVVQLPIHLVDERLTSAAAEQLLRDMGLKPEKRRQQIDQVAAALILQDFLDQRREAEERSAT